MKILSGQQIRDWDTFTIANEPISSYSLMERAGERLLAEIMPLLEGNNTICIFCGKGNNGGDGLVLARLLHFRKVPVLVYIVAHSPNGSPDFEANILRLSNLKIPLKYLNTSADLEGLPNVPIIVDAILGLGLNKPIEGLVFELVSFLNKTRALKISIDIPTGLFADLPLLSNSTVFQAQHTFTFQVPKLNILLPYSGKYIGHLHLVDIGLHPKYLDSISSEYTYLRSEIIQSLYRPKSNFGHKGDFGHGLLMVGGKGTYGAGILSCKAFMRSGGGKLTAVVPKDALAIYHTSCPEVMFIGYGSSHLSGRIEKERHNAIGIGPGIGHELATIHFLRYFLKQNPSNIVLDADAINILAAHLHLLDLLPEDSVLTPHLKEFERLVGKASDDYDRLKKAKEFALKHKIVLVLKGAHTFITDGVEHYFNSTGNVGMATAGSGDVLTGIITSLRCQGYSAIESALIGVYVHGLAGDIALEQQSEGSLIATDIIGHLGKAFKKMLKTK
ncbi:MAG: hydroxyethylthiazole kinase-like uncharacterized protein yjeF [Flavobacteriales bacterium]|jgi:hydroxyethylthiazole kinase-like uncharacterized protein yjeF